MSKKTKINYRKIWEDHNSQKIPPGYHIHHIDGNKDNNNPENLQCLSAEEHWMVHYLQGDPVALYGKFVQGAAEAGRKGGKNAKGKPKRLTEEHKQKSTETITKWSRENKGRKDSEETKKNKSLAQTGEKNGMYGKNHTVEAKMKISEINKGNTYCVGRILSNETKQLISDSREKFFKNGGKSGFSNVYTIISNNKIICTKMHKNDIMLSLNLSEKDFKSLYTWCKRNKDINIMHPKFKIRMINEGKYYDNL